MGKADDESTTTTTVDKGTEEPDLTTKAPEDEDNKSSAPDSSADSATDDDAQGDEDENQGAPDEDEGEDDSDALKERNREGFKLRQLIDSSPVVKTIRDTLQPWVDAGADPREQKDRGRDVESYVKDVVRAQDDISRDNEQVAREIGLFNPGSPDFDESKTQRAYAQYARDMAIEDQNGITVKDANGNDVPLIVGYRMRLLDYMREKAEDYGYRSNSSTSQAKPGKKSGAKAPAKDAKAKMDAAADTPGGSSPGGSRGGKGDSFDELFLSGMDDPYGRHTPKDAHRYS